MMTPRRLLALLLAVRAITTANASLVAGFCPGQCTCIGDDCGYASTGETVEFVEPTSPNAVPCRDDSDCEDASPREGPYYEACWTVADDPPFPSNELRVSYCAEERPRRRLRFSNHVVNSAYVVTGDLAFDGITYETALASVDVFVAAVASLCGVDESAVSVVISQARRRHLSRRRLDDGETGSVKVEYTVAVETAYEAASVSALIEGSSTQDVSIAVNTAATKAGVDEEFADVETTAVGTPTTEVDDRCFFVEGGDFYTDGITLAAVGAEEADEVFACAAARLAGVPQSRVVLLEIEQGFPQVIANFVIAVRGEAEALEVQRRLKYGDGTPPPVPLPPFDVPSPVPLPPGRRLNTGSEGNERATEAIKACAVTRSAAPLAWRDASVDPFVAPPRVVQEREIPADVRGCCCGATGAPDDEPIIPVPVPLPFAFEEPPAPTPVPTITTTTETSRPYAESTTTTTRDE